MKQFCTLALLSTLLLAACSSQKNLTRTATQFFYEDETLRHAHVGVSVYSTRHDKFLYQQNADRFFSPASNTKIVTTYAAMKYLGDSIPGIRYYENDTALFIIPTGDPTLLHPDYATQPVIDFLQQTSKKIYITQDNWKSNAFGMGWSWGDYNFSYSPERSPMPVYGNYIRWYQEKSDQAGFEEGLTFYSIPEVPWKFELSAQSRETFNVQRAWRENIYTLSSGKEEFKVQEVPFITNGIESAVLLLQDTIGKPVHLVGADKIPGNELKIIYSQPIDSMLKPLMHRSDNFFAEQTLIMVGDVLTGQLSDNGAINELRKTIYKDLPNNVRWVDGSGLSRSNHFSPNDFVAILKDLKTTVGMQRIEAVFPTGGTGTLSSLYKEIPGKIFAKTGTLSGVVALSGYLYTKGGDQLIFSFQVNHYRGDANHVRKQFEQFIMYLYNRY